MNDMSVCPQGQVIMIPLPSRMDTFIQQSYAEKFQQRDKVDLFIPLFKKNAVISRQNSNVPYVTYCYLLEGVT
jgi:hypothetical protein